MKRSHARKLARLSWRDFRALYEGMLSGPLLAWYNQNKARAQDVAGGALSEAQQAARGALPMTDWGKWSAYDDEGWTKQKVYFFEEWDTSSHPHNHGVMVFAAKEKDESDWDTKRDRPKVKTRYVVQVSYGPYGEAVEEVEMPFGTRLPQAKAEALRIASPIYRRGELIL